MHLDDLLNTLGALAPLALAEDWDNVGLLIAPTRPKDITTVLLTIDLSFAVMQEALDSGVGAIIAYHPPIFKGLQRLVPGDRTGRLVLTLVENHVTVYSPHTALDATKGGVNDWLTGAFSVATSRAIEPRGHLIGQPEDLQIGHGRLLQLGEPITPDAAIARVKRYLALDTVRCARPTGPADRSASERLIETVALCPGAGGGVLAGTKADLYLTGEMRHHDVLAVTETGSHVLLTEHTNCERGYLPVFEQRLRAAAPALSIHRARQDFDPLAIA
jgi:dinuclear metal center YbgI/SA1388 family protein